MVVLHRFPGKPLCPPQRCDCQQFKDTKQKKKHQTQIFQHKGGHILLDFSLTVKAATLIFISGCGSAISSAKKGKLGSIYNLVKS